MKIEINKIITLGNQEKYLVIDKVVHNDIEYYYVAEVNEDETNIYNKILEVSTNLLNTGKRIDTSLISTNSSVGKLEASTNILER